MAHIAEAAYLAGIIDGEGYIGMSRTGGRPSHPGGKQGHAYLSPFLKIGMTHLPTLQLLQATWGGNIRLHPKQQEHHKQAYLWQLSSQKAVNTLATVWPFLQTKRTQAWLIFQFWADRTRRNGNRISEEEAALREGYKLAIQTANQKGY
jgi:hypothetical protein